jgi:spermidine synthase
MYRVPLLFLNVIIIATCGLIYELIAGTLSSYVLGDSVTQFSFIIGIYLFAMGIGSLLSRFVVRQLAVRFIEIELAVALAGGLLAPVLFLSFAYVSFFRVVLYGLVFLIGVLVGLEIPLLMRILKDKLDFRELVSRVLALDYVGALLASLMFPIFLVPKLGLNRTSILFGLLNAGVGLWATWLLQPSISTFRLAILRIKAAVVIAILIIAMVKADALTTLAEEGLYLDQIVYSKSSPYQRIIITRGKTGFALFLNGNLQFNSFDEYRYHEALVHPAFAALGRPARRVLVLGGGDGLALREILKYPSVEEVRLVDLDPAMTSLSKAYPPLAELNQHSFDDKRVHVENNDAFVWLDRTEDAGFDIAIVDFPDPNNFALGKLYTTRFYKMLREKLKPDAAVVIQCTSPIVARQSFWCIIATLEAAGFYVNPYQVTVPSFGIWGFALARKAEASLPEKLPDSIELHFLNQETFRSMFEFPSDMARPQEPIEINRLDNQALVRYYETEWRRFEPF